MRLYSSLFLGKACKPASDKGYSPNLDLDYADHNYKKYYTVKASLYRGIFWRTIAQLDQFDQFNKPGVLYKPNIFY